MNAGKLYKSINNQFVSDVNYQMHDETETSWWGELTFIASTRISDGDGYVIELDDGRQGRCRLKKRVNRAVSGVPPRYVYHFSGTSALE